MIDYRLDFIVTSGDKLLIQDKCFSTDLRGKINLESRISRFLSISRLFLDKRKFDNLRISLYINALPNELNLFEKDYDNAIPLTDIKQLVNFKKELQND